MRPTARRFIRKENNMATDVVMPQMGESIAEGTIVRWIKKVGDKVDQDEPLFEISTDKVDAEIPSPAAGVVSEIRVKEGETVAINSVVADSAAAEAQLQSGDIILRIDGQPMTTVEQIVRTIAGHNPGDKLHFDFLRDNLPQQVTVTTKPPPGVTVITKPPLDNLPR